MLNAICQYISNYARFEQSITTLCCVVQGITENKGE